jgi:hypothetical protein
MVISCLWCWFSRTVSNGGLPVIGRALFELRERCWCFVADSLPCARGLEMSVCRLQIDTLARKLRRLVHGGPFA